MTELYFNSDEWDELEFKLKFGFKGTLRKPAYYASWGQKLEKYFPEGSIYHIRLNKTLIPIEKTPIKCVCRKLHKERVLNLSKLKYVKINDEKYYEISVENI